jgi:hypothetical protein
MYSGTPWLAKRGAEEGWGEDLWRRVELYRLTLARLGLTLRADVALAAIYAQAPDGTTISSFLDPADEYPLLEALSRLAHAARRRGGESRY